MPKHNYSKTILKEIYRSYVKGDGFFTCTAPHQIKQIIMATKFKSKNKIDLKLCKKLVFANTFFANFCLANTFSAFEKFIKIYSFDQKTKFYNPGLVFSFIDIISTNDLADFINLHAEVIRLKRSHE